MKRDLVIVAFWKVAVSALVLLGGFTAVSDDDFARVVHAQEWAHDPKLDPTGTSWLPVPFWIYGAVMKVFGTSIATARATAFVLGVASALLVYLAARLLLDERKDALLGTLIAVTIPWAGRLGVATVPELPSAALCLLGAATLATDDPRWRRVGGLALTLACLSRYEPWPVAAAFAAICLWERRIIASALALLGPAAWLVHNAIAHGDALHFLARVSAYKEAVGVTMSVITYPLSLLREEPELCIVSALLCIGARGALPKTLPRMAAVMGFLIAVLTFASLSGGAPTHHAGRALLVIWLTMAIYCGAGIRAALRSRQRGFATAVLVTLPLGALWLRPWFARLDSFVDRETELAIGRDARPGLRLEVRDYRYFAILAGNGDPARWIVRREGEQWVIRLP